MSTLKKAPSEVYGVLCREGCESVFDEVVESVKNIGYATMESGMTVSEVKKIADEFNYTQKAYIGTYGEARLERLNEIHTIRALLAHGGQAFRELALNEKLLLVLRKLIAGKFILNQQNGIVNPPQQSYNQGAWHRDLPYQHFTSSSPLAINALFCLDDFTCENGATFVLPASHKSEAFPSAGYVNKNAVQIEAKAGSFILLDCMMFHAGGFNSTHLPRRAINHVYNIPYFKQQINLPMNIKSDSLSYDEKEILGFNYSEPTSISDYLAGVEKKSR